MNEPASTKTTTSTHSQTLELIKAVHLLCKPLVQNPCPNQIDTLEATVVHELSKALYLNRLKQGPVFEHPEAVRGYLAHELRERARETFWILLLNNRHELVHSEALFEGTLNAAAVYPREVLLVALKHHAAAIIIAHNHPSGSPEPSAADHAITKRLKNALALIDVSVLDHFLICKNEVISFAQRGWV